MARSDVSVSEQRAEFMARHQLTHAKWEGGELVEATRPVTPQRQATEVVPGPAARMAAAFAERAKKEHETRFAASHYRPRLDIPAVKDDVPRAVRARESSNGGSPTSKRNR